MIVCMLSFMLYIPYVSAEVPLKAAFIRDHKLWIKEGGIEQKITKDQYVYNPKWSSDGRFLGYLKGEENGEKTFLYVYDTKQKKTYQPYEGMEVFHFQWSPIANQIAYTTWGGLNVTKTENGIPKRFENVALGVSDFVWYPNGKEFIVSSQAQLLPTGWGSVRLFRVPVNANLDSTKIKPFYTIQTDEKDLFAIDATIFQWSKDYKWLSFLAIPTASWSNDSNTLCVLSEAGTNFQAIGKMLINKKWIKWSPYENKLAYISGEGRFLVQDKKMTIADIPIVSRQKEYTPKDYVDLDLEWLSKEAIIVARAKENKTWQEGPVPIMYSKLYVVNLKTAQQKQFTFPSEKEIDTSPKVIGSFITWIREGHEKSAMIKEGINGKEQIWIKKVDEAPVIYP
ncbi:translocation protein TolB [Niallia nealsonii]|uniref:Translocation protein TolB n=2 Tax=Niallia nealsonii TaxID=115979 RepID=A0A2N0YWY3_9BACI|nr:translocation protein TolB [Niallia nealsonii]